MARARNKENRKADDAAYRERNREAIRKRDAEWRLKNAERVNSYAREYYNANKERKKELDKRSRAKNIVRYTEYQKAYTALHPEKARARSRKYRESHRKLINQRRMESYHKNRDAELKRLERYRKTHKTERREYMRTYLANYKYIRKANEKAGGGRFTQKQIDDLFLRQGKKCATCKVRIAKRGKFRYHIDHVMPVKRHGSNDISNLQLLCVRCNTRKKAKHPDDWAKENGLLFC